MKRGFTLIEMLVVIGIIVALIGSSLGLLSHVRKSAENARARELVSQVATALESIYDADGVWPKTIREKSSESDSVLDEKVAYVLGSRKVYTVTCNDTTKSAVGADRFGILSPWGADAVKRLGQNASLTTKVAGGGTIKDHLVRFKVDLDGDGIIEDASIGGQSVNIRAHAAVWCAGSKGTMESYSKGKKGDGIYSWAPGQTVNAR